MRNRRPVLCAVVFMALLRMGGRDAIFAADTPSARKDAGPEGIIPDMVVTATREGRAAQTAPYSATGIGSAVLRVEQPPRTLPQAFESLPGVMVQKTGPAQGSPYIRGFTGYRTLFLVDGVRLNNSAFRDGPNQYWNTVDPLLLQRLELVYGPSSMLYGSDAIGGTVQAFSRGRESLRPGSTLDRRLYGRYGSAENAYVARAETIALLVDSLTATLGYSWKEFGDVRGGRDTGRQQKTGYDERHWDAKIEGAAGETTTWTLAHQSGEIKDAWRTHRTIYGIDWKGLSVGDELRHSFDQRRELTYLQVAVRPESDWLHALRAGVSRHLQAEDRDRARTGNRYDVQGFEVESYGAFFSLRSPSPLGTLTYGADFGHDIVSSYSRTLHPDGTVKSVAIQGPVGDDATYSMLGAYLQDEWALGEQVMLILGARYERAEAEAKKVENPNDGSRMTVTGDWEAFTGGIRLGVHPGARKDWNLYAGLSQGFRAPNLSDLTRFGMARTDEFETPTPDLDPERYLSAEIGIKTGTSRLSAQAAYYYTWIDGMIVRTPTGRQVDGAWEVTKKNAGDGYVQGIDLNARARLSRLFVLSGNFSWMDGEVESYPTSDTTKEREPISRLMPPTGRAALRWTPVASFWLEGVCTVAAKADRLSRSDRGDTGRIPQGGTPGYTVWDMRAGWEVSDGLALSFALENLADTDYRIHGSGLNEPGRNIVLAADWTF